MSPENIPILDSANEDGRTFQADLSSLARGRVYAACIALALVCNFVLGKDMAWDTLNYHLYAGFSALNDRFNQDYFAAGPLSYFNPFAYVPFYLMVHAGLPALLICSVFATVHSIILWLTYELGAAVCPSEDNRQKILCGCCALLLAFMNPVLMQETGSCFADITTAELALGAWVILASGLRTPNATRMIVAGLLLGCASALKLNNALHSIAGLTVLAALPTTWWRKLRYAFIYSVSISISFLAVSAPWSYRLMKAFGNPFFPMFNNLLRSPEYTTEAATHYRFIPDSLSAALWRPFAMIDPMQMVHEELSAPDPRYALLIVLVTILICRWWWGRGAQATEQGNQPKYEFSTRVLLGLGVGFCVDWTLWLRVSGNSRYFLTMACVAAALVMGLLFRVFERRPKALAYALTLIFATQATQLYMGAEYRWNSAAWGGPWFDITLPRKLQTEPNLYLTMGAQSNSFLAPFLNKGSGMVNFSGGYTLDPEGANGVKVRALIARYSPQVRVLIRGKKLYQNSDFRAPRRSEVDDALQPYGLRTDLSDCLPIVIHGLTPDLEIRYESSVPMEPRDLDTTYLVSCHLEPDISDQSTLLARKRQVDIVLNRLEDACPQLFQPRRPVTVHDGEVWRRLYPSTDITAWVSYGHVKFSDPIRAERGVTDLGTEKSWAAAPLQVQCGSRNGIYFAHVEPLGQ